MGIIETLTDEKSVDAYLDRQGEQDTATLTQVIESTSAAIRGIDSRKARWDSAYESGVIDLHTYGQKLTELEGEKERLAGVLVDARKQLQARKDHTKRRERLLQTKIPPLEDAKRGEIKRLLRSLIQCIIIKNGEPVDVTFA